MKKLLILIGILLLIGCKEEQEYVYRTFEIRYENRIDTVVATRCEAANWTSGGWGIKVFDGDDVTGFYNLPKKNNQAPFTIREINP